MAVYEVYSHPIQQRYKSSFCTKASVFIIVMFLLTSIPPFLVTYSSQGFWIKEGVYREQAEVNFKHELLLILETSDSYIAWSTYEHFNVLEQSNLVVPVVKTREEDNNMDGKADKLHYNIKVPLLDTQVFSVKLILIFDYQLHRQTKLKMESMAYIYHNSAISGAELFTDGELQLRLKSPLAHKGSDVRYNVPVINKESIFSTDYQLKNIFSKYLERNVTTSYVCEYPVWIADRATSQHFEIKGVIRYPQELIPYIPGFWYVIKWGWIQYVSVLLIFIMIIGRLKTFAFQNQVIDSIVEKPLKK
ncbi:transmembrane protein 231-like [Antedon mediterranea]|uniref:transmembrane protein 231-like n=1 Tax=Antedon mediterranea TaxID=105859 RepID=UPI003AF96649